MSPEDFIREAVGRDLSKEQIDAFAIASGNDRTAAFNSIMVCLAELFLKGEVGFWDADHIANDVWPLMLDDAIERDVPLPSPAFEIYEAFDAGEWNPGNAAQDSVERPTRPLLEKLLGG